MTDWKVDQDDLICVLRESLDLQSPGEKDRELIVFRKTGDTLAEVFRFKSELMLISMYPHWDRGGDLITVWQGGSAYHFYVFNYSNRKVRVVLESGSKSPPEIFGSIRSPLSKPYILATDTMGYPADSKKWKTKVYKWNGHEYSLSETVQYARRLTKLK